MTSFASRSRCLLAGALLAAALPACGGARPAVRCPPLQGSGEWVLDMSARGADFRVAGRLRFADQGGTTDLVATSAEGAREPLQYPVENLVVSGDSVSFSFAPIGYRLRGRCTGQDSIHGTFSVPQPPFDDLTGRWTLSR